jgi:tetratricopeptide (TPR) repeat protein
MRFPVLQAFLLSFVFVLAACSVPGKETANNPAPADTLVKAKAPVSGFTADCRLLRREAFRMDSILLTQMEIDQAAAAKAIEAFTNLAHYCPGDSTSPVYLVKTAQVARAINNIPQARLALDKCLTDYPNFKDRAAALFLLAQLYDEVTYLNDEQEAKALYQKIIDEHPGSPWAESAKGAIRFIGKTDQQIMEELKKKNK